MISNLPDRIFLSGFMGSGKSTLGKELAQKLDCDFLDLDDRIEERTGQSIPEIFDDLGEGAFRTAERRALLNVCRDFEGVVALGGGSLQNQHLVDHLKLNGLLVFIETPISIILDRIFDDENRPLLLDESGNTKSRDTLIDELKVIYDERRPLYEQAEITIEDDGSSSARELSETLLNKIKNHVEYY